jgi:hypothetical protein
VTPPEAARRLAAVALFVVVLVAGGGAAAVETRAGLRVEVVVHEVGRPIQLAFDGAGRLVVLSHGRRGDAAGEILRLDIRGALPIDAGRAPRVVLPFSTAPRKTALGSLAVDRRTGDIFLGEENGNRVYRLSSDHRLDTVAVGLRHLLGGSSIALDDEGRLVVLDYASSETDGRAETPPARGLESFAPEGYQGPLVFRVRLDDGASLPRRLDVLRPFFPRGWLSPAGEPLSRFVAVAARPDGELVVMDSLGQLSVLTPAGTVRPIVRLPAGHYHRTSVAIARDGSVLVSTGFHVRRLYQVSREAVVTTLVSELGDPGGVAVDGAGNIYVAETALHRVIRLVP